MELVLSILSDNALYLYQMLTDGHTDECTYKRT